MIITFLSALRFGIFDQEGHIPIALTIFHNNLYPPHDYFRPDYLLRYHFGGDLFAGAISYICKIRITYAFELVAGVMAGMSFLGYFSFGWIITRNYKLSFICAFCCFFGSGLSWLNSLLNFASYDNFRAFIENFLKRGTHGAFIYSPSLISYTSTSALGYPTLMFCLSLFNQLLKKESIKENIPNIICLGISLFCLSFFAGWLSLTFLSGMSIYMGILLLIQVFKKQNIKSNLIKTSLFLLIFFIFNKLCGNQMYSAEQALGRANIFNLGIKSNPFSILVWKEADETNSILTTMSCFSWDFISEFGLSLLLLPVIFFYLNKSKDGFALLLLCCAATTMPLPLIFDFKLNPVDFNRLFAFGNTILILLITISLGVLFQNFIKNKVIVLIYIFCFCLSPFSAFILGFIFSPQIYLNPEFISLTLNKFNAINSPKEFIAKLIEINKESWRLKYAFHNKYAKEVSFFVKNSKPEDAAISSIPGVPVYSGVYTYIPSMMYGLKDQIYSHFDNIYPTIISTLDPYLLSELNIKWIGYDEVSKSKLPKETQELLNNERFFKLAYTSSIQPDPKNKVNYEIFHVEDLSDLIKNTERKTGWILVNKEGIPLEISRKISNNISLFSSNQNALQYLKQLTSQNQTLKNELITSQPIIIKTTKEQLAQSGLNIKLEEKI